MRNPRTKTLVASPTEPRASSDTSQWTDRYWISYGRLQARSMTLNFSLVMSTRSPQSPVKSVIPRLVHREKVQALQFIRKILYFPYLSSSLSVFFGSVQVSFEYQQCSWSRIPPCIFSHSSAEDWDPFAPLSTVCRWLVYLLIHGLKQAILENASRIWLLNCKKLSCGRKRQEPLINIVLPPLPQLPPQKFLLRELRKSGGTSCPFEYPFCGCFEIMLWFVWKSDLVRDDVKHWKFHRASAGVAVAQFSDSLRAVRGFSERRLDTYAWSKLWFPFS